MKVLADEMLSRDLDITRCIDEAAKLTSGWDSYDAPAPAPVAVEHARRFADCLDEIGPSPVRVGATVRGGISFTFQQGIREAFLEFYNTGKAYVMLSSLVDPDEEPLIHPIVPEDVQLRHLIEEIREYLNA